ncbi:hypothetical protein Hanom_Chr16g01503721 [Helianthus anomalus]
MGIVTHGATQNKQIGPTRIRGTRKGHSDLSRRATGFSSSFFRLFHLLTLVRIPSTWISATYCISIIKTH